ncbi:hypothetical protein OG539_32705 [Actinacidiphila glaucinigra]|uniref:hypothetical protein n=1 Tax=Actinacidiphila glaucinigra TaxID=235986 RepID=UPI003243ED17
MLTKTPPPPYMSSADQAPRTSRDLYAEARGYEDWARGLFRGYRSPVDADGRTWTLDEIYAHMWTVRRAGTEAEARENAARQAAYNVQRAMTEADRPAHAAASHVRREILQETVDRLTAMDARHMRGADFDALADAQAELALIGGAR